MFHSPAGALPEAHSAADAMAVPVLWRWSPGRAGLLALGVAGLCLLMPGPAMRADSTINAVDRYAYGANLGWIDARANFEHGARVGEFICAGYLYGANVGWINLGNGEPADGIYYGNDSAEDFGVNRDPLGELTGRAWGANIGWLIFTNRTAAGASFDGPRVDPFTGRFNGYVFAPNVGWITLSNLFAQVKTDVVTPGIDSDGDGIPDAWELSQVGGLDRMTATSNLDGDRATDREEYLADTDPLTGGDELRVTGFSASADGTSGTITWTTRPTRVYRIEERLGLDLGLPWGDAGFGWMRADPGATTTRTLIATTAAHRYLRIEAAPPLAP
jgi:hypothetical protein